MSSHPYDSGFRITLEQKERFRHDGFTKLDEFFNEEVVNMLLARVEIEMNQGLAVGLSTDSMFNRAKYDFDDEKAEVYELLERPYLREALTDLVEHDLFLTFEQCFEIEKCVNKGFPWHVGAQSFGFQPADEFACTVWAPLHPVDTKGQRGGMAYVPENVISGDFIFRQIEPVIVSTMKAMEEAGSKTSISDYYALRTGVLNSPAMTTILENHQIEEDFAPGDVLVFNKRVVHRTIMLGEGALPRRAAYVMRFVDLGSHYDLKRAQDLEFPVEKYGKGLIPYKPFTRQHAEIAEAGARDGDILAECSYFNYPERRTIRRYSNNGVCGH